MLKYVLIIILLVCILGGFYIYNEYFRVKNIFEEIKLPMPLYQP